jgi:acyl-CoA thioesterase-1
MHHARMAQPLFRYVAVGDSSGVGVGAGDDGGYPERLFQRLKATGVHVGILNLCRSGATSRDVAQGPAQKAAAARPALVTLGVGTNDGWRMVPTSSFARNLATIADALESSGAQVVVSNIIDLSAAPAAAAARAWLGVTPQVILARINELNAAIEALAARPRFSVVDLFAFSQKEVPLHPEYFAPDGFHPSAVGYDRWADLLWPHVERIARAFTASAPSA